MEDGWRVARWRGRVWKCSEGAESTPEEGSTGTDGIDRAGSTSGPYCAGRAWRRRRAIDSSAMDDGYYSVESILAEAQVRPRVWPSWARRATRVPLLNLAACLAVDRPIDVQCAVARLRTAPVSRARAGGPSRCECTSTPGAFASLVAPAAQSP